MQSTDESNEKLPLKETSTKVNIAGVIADVKVRQVYVNTGKKPIEAIYVFPASTRAAVYGMEMQVGKRAIIAKIEEKEKARKDYEQAKNEGKTASLLEQERPNVFEMNVANILPNDTIIVLLSYTELLVPEEGVYEFAYPTVVGPRYSNKSGKEKTSEKWVDNPFLKEGENSTSRFDIQTTINAGLPIQQISCSTHKVNISYQSKSSATMLLDVSEKDGGNRDYILKYRLAGEQIEAGLLLSESKDENFFLLMAQPPKRIEATKIPQREYVFIVDVSGSMNGQPLDIAKELLKNLVSNLKPTDKFNVILFAGSSDVFSEESVAANEANIKTALRIISNYAGGGSTELLPALKTAFALKGAEGFSRTFVVVTDGYVNVEKETFDLIRKNLNQANLFAFGIGSSVNRYIIEGMGRVGMGVPFIITNSDEAKAKAEKFRKYIQNPMLTKIKVSYKNFEVYDIEPIAIPDVLAERPILIFGKFKGKPQGEIILTGMTGEGKYEAKIPISSAKTEGNEALKYLWARHKIELLDDYAKLETMNEHRYTELSVEIIKEVTQLGLKYNLLTAYTSFVAIDTEVRNKEKNATTVKQPLPLPKGVSNNAIGFSVAANAQNINSAESHNLNSNHFYHMNKTGSVKRALGGAARAILPQERSKIYGDTLFLNWEIYNHISFANSITKYEVQIFNLNDELAFKTQTSAKSLLIPLSAAKLASVNILVVKIISLDSKGKQLENVAALDGDAIVKLEASEKQNITNEITKLQQSFTTETVSERFIKLAILFDTNELYADAMLAYYNAIVLAPANEKSKFETKYQEFLLRNGLK